MKIDDGLQETVTAVTVETGWVLPPPPPPPPQLDIKQLARRLPRMIDGNPARVELMLEDLKQDQSMGVTPN